MWQISTLAVCIYFIIGCVRYLTIGKEVLDHIEEHARSEFVRRWHEHPDSALPEKRRRQALVMMFVICLWHTTFGIKVPREEKDDGNS